MAPFSFSTIICGGPDQSTQQAKLVRISDLANSEQFFLLLLRLWSLSCSKCSIKKTKIGIRLVSFVWSYVRISIKSSRILSWYTSSSMEVGFATVVIHLLEVALGTLCRLGRSPLIPRTGVKCSVGSVPWKGIRVVIWSPLHFSSLVVRKMQSEMMILTRDLVPSSKQWNRPFMSILPRSFIWAANLVTSLFLLDLRTNSSECARYLIRPRNEILVGFGVKI